MPDADALKVAFLDCHADGHQWKHHRGPVDPSQAEPGLKPPGHLFGTVGRRSSCTSCGGERIRWYARNGEVINRYRMRDGYYHKRSAPDDFAPSRREYRQDLVRTLFAEFEAAVGKAVTRRSVANA